MVSEPRLQSGGTKKYLSQQSVCFTSWKERNTLKYHRLCKLDFKLWGKSCMEVAPHFFLVSTSREVSPGEAGLQFCLHTDQKTQVIKGDGKGAGIPLTYSCEPFFIQLQAKSHRYSIVTQEEILTAPGWSSKVTGTLLASRLLHLQPSASPASFSLA